MDSRNDQIGTLASPPHSVAPRQLASPVDERDHVQGSLHAPTTLVMYSDFECLHCRRVYASLKRILADLPAILQLVVRHFPLVHDHPHAGIAARAAEAASRQGRFWEMHDMLFENQSALHAHALRGYAGAIGLDLDMFDRDLADNAVTDRVERDIASGRSNGVRGTPDLFVNGRRLEDAWNLTALRSAIVQAAA